LSSQESLGRFKRVKRDGKRTFYCEVRTAQREVERGSCEFQRSVFAYTNLRDG